MAKLAKYLKPFLVGLFLAILLLFGQAFSELSLPNYMSEIVNVGIQQNGIEHAAPEAISQQGLKLMMTVMTEPEKQLVTDNYQLVALTDQRADGKTYGSLYPKAVDSIFVQKKVDNTALAALDKTFGTATWTFINIMQSASGQMPQGNTPGDFANLDISKLYAVQPMLDKIPASVLAAAHDKALANDDQMLKQSGIILTKAFYSEIGLTISSLQSAYIFKIGLMMLVVALLGGVATILVSLISSRIAAGVARNLRSDLFQKIESFSNAEFDKFSAASLITRTTNDVTQIQLLLMIGIRMITYAPILGIGGIIMAINKSQSMSWIIAVAVIVLIGMIIVIMAIAMPKFKIIQKQVDRLNLVSRESLSGMMVIRAFGTQQHEKERFETANADLTNTNLFVSRVMVFMMPAMTLIMNGTTLIVIWVGAHQIANSTMQVGDMMAFIQYAMQIIMAFLMISMMFIFVPRAAVSAKRIAEVLETEATILDPATPEPFVPAKKGIVEFDHVNFHYQGAEEDALHDITFTALPGQTTAIIGSTGSGKSTIASLILRFYDVTAGRIMVGGVDIRQVKQKDLRSRIGYVPQSGGLLSGTITSNISYGKDDATEAEVEAAATIAQAMEFISEKPEGLKAEISQGGVNVSGGQKQRLSIARALTKSPEILIFDDSFSALDFKTDVALRKALKEHVGTSTLIIVAQRVSTILNAEQIIVLDDGRIVGHGTHAELLKNCPQYYEIASSQLSQEELA